MFQMLGQGREKVPAFMELIQIEETGDTSIIIRGDLTRVEWHNFVGRGSSHSAQKRGF